MFSKVKDIQSKLRFGNDGTDGNDLYPPYNPNIKVANQYIHVTNVTNVTNNSLTVSKNDEKKETVLKNE